MKVVWFCHSLISDWNHGNAHFLRGVVTDLVRRGHDVRVFEPRDAWSVANLVQERGETALTAYRSVYPHLDIERYTSSLDLDVALDGADLVIVHEWNDPALVARIGQKRRSGNFTLLFHDTHHRAATAPSDMSRYDLRDYDGVLAFGNAIREIYRERGWARAAWTWHEAADVRVFAPRANRPIEGDVIWIGNWGDDERTAELRTMLVDPIAALRLRATVFGVRYPQYALDALAAANIHYGGWLPNYDAPEMFARYRATVHVPRRPYATALPGIPTIRMFEALACGIPLVSAPWSDEEQLFTAGRDYLVAKDGEHMRHLLTLLVQDRVFAQAIAAQGLETILSRHTCAHRVDELLTIVDSLRAPKRAAS